MTDVSTAAHAAHSSSRHAVYYAMRARETPELREHFLREAARARADARWFLDWARRAKDEAADERLKVAA